MILVNRLVQGNKQSNLLRRAQMNTDTFSSREHNALVMKDWRGHKEMATNSGGGGTMGEHVLKLGFSFNSDDVKPKKPVGKSETLLPNGRGSSWSV